jgi:hypothetical protein
MMDATAYQQDHSLAMSQLIYDFSIGLNHAVIYSKNISNVLGLNATPLLQHIE